MSRLKRPPAGMCNELWLGHSVKASGPHAGRSLSITLVRAFTVSRGRDSPVVKVTRSCPVLLLTRRVRQRYALNLSRALTSSRGCDVVVRRRGCRSRQLTMVQITKSTPKALK
ncbi:hypothetical protein TNCV_223981 [Trichonephila clavipes]|nr:hypothetical protein TNCV_223981 [Trichonephila clavipes]